MIVSKSPSCRIFMSLFLAAAVAFMSSVATAQEAPRSAADAPCCFNVRLLTNEGIGEAGELFRLMEADGDLTFEPVFNGDAVSPQLLWRQHFGVWIGPFRGSGIEAWLCERNAHVCRKGGGFDRMQKAPAGTNPSVAGLSCDGTLPPYILCLPTLKLSVYRETVTREVNRAREDLAKIVTANLLGCDEWEAECRLLINNLNPSRPAVADPEASNYNGPIRLPYKAIRVELPARPGESVADQAQRATALFGRFTTQAGLVAREGTYAVLTDERPLPGKTPVSQAFSSLEDGAALEAAVQKGISYPYSDAAGLSRRALLPPVTVGVWDKFVDDLHCAFKVGDHSAVRYADGAQRRRLEDDAVLAHYPRPAGPCATLRAPGDDQVDHGTAVAGLIAAQPGAGLPGGLNPRAEIWSKNLNDLLDASTDPILDFNASAALPLTVINISQSIPDAYRTQFDRILFGDRDSSGNLKGGYATDIVIVVAAGNDGIPFAEKCSLYPACLGARGDGLAIISVSASNASGKDLLRCNAFDPTQAPGICNGTPATTEATNYGREFDVMAPGVAFTTLYGDTFGTDIGTSMAAPRVSALASLLVSAAGVRLPNGRMQTPTALDVRARILSTADPVRAASGKAFVRFGAVNFGRALDFRTSIIEPMDPDSVVCGGAIEDCRLRKWRVPDQLLSGTVSGKDFSVSWPNVLRLQFLNDGQNGAAIYHLVYIDREARSVRQAEMSIAPTTKVAFYGDGNLSWKPTVTSLREYTACAFVSGCPSFAP